MNDFMILIKQMMMGDTVSLFFNDPQSNGRIEWVCEEWSYESGRGYFICDYDNENYTRYSPEEMNTAFSWEDAASIRLKKEYNYSRQIPSVISLDIFNDAQMEIASTSIERIEDIPIHDISQDDISKNSVEPTKKHLKILRFIPTTINTECNPLYETMTFSEATDNWALGKSTLRMMIRSNRLKKGKDYRKSGSQWLITKKAMITLYGKQKKIKNSFNKE